MSTGQHRVLARQLRRLGLDATTPPDAAQWARLLAAVSDVYAEHDRSRYVLERAMRISAEEMHDLHEVLRSRALVDAMTGLANRAGLLEGLERVVDRSAHGEGPLGVCFLDLDGFKAVNDRYGHGAGDDLIVAAAGRIRSGSRGTDLVARLGGDEFVVVCGPGVRREDVLASADRIAASLAQPFVLGAATVAVTASVGVAVGDGTGRTTDDFVRASDDAMYAAKAAGKNRVHCLDLDAPAA